MRKTEAKDGLRKYCVTILSSEIEGGDVHRDYIDDAASDILSWLDKNPLVEKDELEAKQRKLKRVVKHWRGHRIAHDGANI